MSESAPAPRPTAAGMYDYYLGGTENTPADRAAAEQVIRHIPPIVDTAWANRGFLQRAVSRMATEWGIRQFLDIGAGLPTQRNTHDVVAELTSDGRVVYVDNDPVVVARGNELLASAGTAAAAGRTAMVEGDIRRPNEIFDHPGTRRLIDVTAPVGVLMVAVMHFVPDEDDPYGLVKQYMEAVPSGSYLALSHASADQMTLTDELVEALREIFMRMPNPPMSRTRHEIARFFQGLAVVPPYPHAHPEVAFVGLWGAEDAAEADSEGARWTYAAVARKP
jgi:S-adenosyl methyltransferase